MARHNEPDLPLRVRRVSVGEQSRRQVAAVRERIFDRDERTCLAAGTTTLCAGGLTIQHAIGRGMGGSAALDRPALLRTLCSHHNALIESSHLMRVLAERNGWSIRRFSADVDPLELPVRYPGSRWYLLDDDFGRDEVWP